MLKTKKFINKLSGFQKITCLILMLIFVLLVSIGIPTLARYINRNIIITTSVWDGSVATSYKSGAGTEADPFVISNGSELAYFHTQLLLDDYEDTFFELSNDIILNDGVFSYDEQDRIQYLFNGSTYFVGDYSNSYYNNPNRTGSIRGTVNVFNVLDGFKGTFDGNSFRIHGLYITDEYNEELALFTNLEGNIKNLYIENSIIYGGLTTAGVASTADNSSLSNIMFEGYIVGRNNNLTKTVNSFIDTSIIYMQNVETTNYIDLTNNIPVVGSVIVSTSITGDYIIEGANGAETVVKINDVTVSNGSFDIDLGTNILNNVSVSTYTDSQEEVTLTLSNLSYNIVYQYAVSGGIVANSSNTTITNVINKSNVYGDTVSGGIVGVTTGLLDINQSYNIGNINASYVSGGLIGTIEKSNDNIVVNKSYNTGNMTASNIGGLIGYINNNTGSVLIDNVFNTSTTNYSIGTINNTNVNVNNAYFVNGVTAVNNGQINGSFTIATMEELEDKDFVITNLSFGEFIDFNDLEVNSGNVWVYEQDYLPILFIDDLNNPIASINVDSYNWNNLTYELSAIRFDSDFEFTIEEILPIQEKYYYISNSVEALSYAEISGIDSWNLYNNSIQISEDGIYVIYVKIVDPEDNITYMNTDLLILGPSEPFASITVDNNLWTDLRENLDYIYIDRQKYITIEATDDLFGISTVKYYIADEELSINDLNELNNDNWINYSEEILINEDGTYVIYVKATNNFDDITYVNSDYIILGGYIKTDLILGRNPSSYFEEDPYITDKSSITLNFNYSSTYSDYVGDFTHNLVSNILLPLGTKITLIDNVENKVYKYKITTDQDNYNYDNSCEYGDLYCTKVATYPFTLFKEIGTGSVDKLFVESNYYNEGLINEDFTIIVDLYNTNISTNYDNVAMYLELYDYNGDIVRPTLFNTIEEFNIYSTVGVLDTAADLFLTTDYSGNPIEFNSDSSTNINITSGISYKYVNDFKIIDTTYEDKEIGLSIKLVDSYGNVVDKEYLKNMAFQIGDNKYYLEEDNIVRISLKNGIDEVEATLTIITNENNSDLEVGTYYLKISNYASYDGYYYEELGDMEINIPVIVSDSTSNIIYSFDVITDDENRIIRKLNEEVEVLFDILQSGPLENPKIRVALYKKEQLTAYNQDYSIVDLSYYITNNLVEYTNNVYYVTNNPIEYKEPDYLYNNFELNLITNNFYNTGYKFEFYLYDGDNRIGTIQKYFIVR